MLVLSRGESQKIYIGPDIVLTVVEIDRNRVKLGFEAPDGVPIMRSEIRDRFTHENGRLVAKHPK